MRIEKIVDLQREFFYTDKTKETAFRKTQLKRLYKAVKDHEEEIYKALQADLNKSEFETYLVEIGTVLSEIKEAVRSLDQWSSPRWLKTSPACFPASSMTIREPYGVVLILAPWNYPFNLAITPLIGAIAAGNCAILKCSRHSSHTSQVIQEMINETFRAHYIYCADADEDYDGMLRLRYDYIFFTGSERVGKIVMQAASHHVTPVSLELGGKSPCFVDETANIKMAAKRIIWGKLLNAGQTCVAPDYVLVDEHVKAELLKEMKHQIFKRYPSPLQNDQYPKIIDESHFNKLKGFIDQEASKWGGDYDEESRKIAPVIFPDTTFHSRIMEEEIFGPIIPVIAYKDLDKVIDVVKRRPKPLACYIFTGDKNYWKKLASEVSFGGGCINDTIMHLANSSLPFGGVGSSGMGRYHGRYSFETFSHEKGILKNTRSFDLPIRYAPYRKSYLKLIKRLLE